MTTGFLESGRNLLAGLLDLGRTRFELFSTELREELTHLTVAIVGGIAALVLAAFGLMFSAFAVIFSVSESNRLTATICVAVFFFLAAAVVAWQLRRLAVAKPRPFDATISELK